MNEWVKLEVRMPQNQENILKSLEAVNREIGNNLKEIQKRLKIAEEFLSQIKTIFHSTREYSQQIFDMHSELNNAKFDFIHFLSQCGNVTSAVEVHSDSDSASAEPVAFPSHAEPASSPDQHLHDECQ